jgi:hypothetical protein
MSICVCLQRALPLQLGLELFQSSAACLSMQSSLHEMFESKALSPTVVQPQLDMEELRLTHQFERRCYMKFTWISIKQTSDGLFHNETH